MIRRPATRTIRFRRAAGALVALPILLWLGAGTASAHAILQSVDPVDGSTLVSAPPLVRLVYSEPVTASLSAVGLLDAEGHAVPGVVVSADPSDPAALDVSLPPLSSSAYRLTWRVIDEQDFHVTTGTVVFGIGAPAPVSVADQVASASLPEVGLRWLVLALLASACGGLLLLVVLLRLPARFDGPAVALQRRLLRVATAASGAAAVSNGGLFLLQANGAGGMGIGPAALLGTTFGTAWAIEEAVLVVLFVILASGMRRNPSAAPSFRVALIGGLLFGLAGVQALTGHVATGPGQETPIRWIALTAHLVAMLAWVGGLAALAIAVGPLLRGPRADISLARAVLGRFWLVAAPALAVLAVTGMYLGGQLVASADALLLTPYGQALIIKTCLALVAVSLGGLNAAALHPMLATRMQRAVPFLVRFVPSRARLRGVVAAEAGAALAVVLAAAFMSASPPARGPRFDPVPALVAQGPVAARADDLVVTLAIRPDRPGPNFADIGVLDTRRPAPAPIGAVTVRLFPPAGTGGTTLEARASAPGRYEIDNLPIDQGGPWRLAVEIDRVGLRPASVEIPWAVSPPLSAPHPVLVSDAPLAPIGTFLALALGFLLGALGIAVNVRKRGHRPGRSAAAFATSPPVTQAGSES